MSRSYKHTPVYKAKGNRSKERSRFQKARQISEVLPQKMKNKEDGYALCYR